MEQVQEFRAEVRAWLADNLVGEFAKPLELGELAGEVVGQPGAYLGPELLDLFHPCRLTYQALALLEERR